MSSLFDARVVAEPTSYHRLRRLAITGLLATPAAMAATTLAAALARAAGVDFEVPEGGEAIPLPGLAVVTGFFSIVGIVIAAALLRWSARPAQRFVWTAVPLTAISLVPPLLSGADTATITALVGLHLVAATVMIPTLARSLPPEPVEQRVGSGADGAVPGPHNRAGYAGKSGFRGSHTVPGAGRTPRAR